ncbi:hypothetical protein MP228_001728 [Amoeboaphelidium protococcarum]|nr:hypothetical protein MP228_001728 [Amoeboaphelidium protococcarum]
MIWDRDLNSMVDLATNLLPFIGSVTVASISGIAPRLGPGRALSIAFRSKVSPYRGELSDRKELIPQLISMSNYRRQNYVVVTGPKGVGKSCLIDTAFRNTCGVVRVAADAGMTKTEIVDAALRELTGLNSRFSIANPYVNSRRVIFWYRLLSRGDSPIIIINASERQPGQPFASLAAASRTLNEDFQLRVVIDGSPGALEPMLFGTKRENVLDIVPMDRGMVQNLPQLQTMLAHVNRLNLSDVVWSVLGGVPADYEKLDKSISIALDTAPASVHSVIGEYLRNQVSQAIDIVKEAKRLTSDMPRILSKMDLNTLLIIDEELPNEWKRPTPDKVLRKVEKEGKWVLVPSTNAIGLVLRHQLTEKPTLEKLIELASQQKCT